MKPVVRHGNTSLSREFVSPLEPGPSSVSSRVALPGCFPFYLHVQENWLPCGHPVLRTLFRTLFEHGPEPRSEPRILYSMTTFSWPFLTPPFQFCAVTVLSPSPFTQA